jgi:hypothetical protein
MFSRSRKTAMVELVLRVVIIILKAILTEAERFAYLHDEEV